MEFSVTGCGEGHQSSGWYPLTDLGPFRAITRDTLQAPADGRTHLWLGPSEMIVKGRPAWRIHREVPVSYRRRRGGQSKVSGTWRAPLEPPIGFSGDREVARTHRAGETTGAPDLLAQPVDMPRCGCRGRDGRGPLPSTGKESIKVRNGTRRCSVKDARYRHETQIATSRIASHVCKGFDSGFHAEHRVREAPDFIAHRKQLATRLGCAISTKRYLIRVLSCVTRPCFFSQAGAGRIGDVHGEMMAVVLRDLFAGLTEDQALRGPTFTLGERPRSYPGSRYTAPA